MQPGTIYLVLEEPCNAFLRLLFRSLPESEMYAWAVFAYAIGSPPPKCPTVQAFLPPISAIFFSLEGKELNNANRFSGMKELRSSCTTFFRILLELEAKRTERANRGISRRNMTYYL
jgi:hypothetical protein